MSEKARPQSEWPEREPGRIRATLGDGEVRSTICPWCEYDVPPVESQDEAGRARRWVGRASVAGSMRFSMPDSRTASSRFIVLVDYGYDGLGVPNPDEPLPSFGTREEATEHAKQIGLISPKGRRNEAEIVEVHIAEGRSVKGDEGKLREALEEIAGQFVEGQRKTYRNPDAAMDHIREVARAALAAHQEPHAPSCNLRLGSKTMGCSCGADEANAAQREADDTVWRGCIDPEQPDLPCLNCGRPYREHEPRTNRGCPEPGTPGPLTPDVLIEALKMLEAFAVDKWGTTNPILVPEGDKGLQGHYYAAIAKLRALASTGPREGE